MSSAGPLDQQSSGATSNGADHFGSPSPGGQSRRQSGSHRCAAFRSGSEVYRFFCATDSFSTLELYDLLFLAIDVRHVFSLRLLFSARERLASPWLELAEDRLPPRSPEPQRRRVDFLPLGAPPHRASPVGTLVRPFLARQESMPPRRRGSVRRHPPLRCGPQAGASSIVPGLPIAIEAAVVAGSRTAR